MTTLEVEEKIVKTVLQIFSDGMIPTIEMIRIAVHDITKTFYKMKLIINAATVDEDRIAKKIETLCNVYVPTMSSLDDIRGHQEWLSSRRAEIHWRFWKRYEQFLENDSDMPPQVIRQLDNVTDQILSRLEDPLRPSSWDRRGMVVGQVQSGKTSNYTALICKAADAGYKLIIVLAGMHNSLRSQTQHRLDEGFLGVDTQRRKLFDSNDIRFGVGLLQGVEFYRVHSLTSSAESGDFSRKVSKQAHFMIGGTEPVLLVVKKNVSVLENLLTWQLGDQGNTQGQVRDVPLLLIDDEADNASVNTNPIFDENGKPDPELDPSRINGLIRKLLKRFEQSAYIGYTATPFANIFITDK